MSAAAPITTESPAPPTAHEVIEQYVTARAVVEGGRARLLEAIRKEGTSRFMTLTAFSEEVAEKAGVKAKTAWSNLYDGRSEHVIAKALEVLGYAVPQGDAD